MAHCIVTGGAGFIGSHLADKLIEEGHTVSIIDNLSLGKRKFVNAAATLHEVDIRDMEAMKPLFSEVDVVFHLAADPRLPVSIEDPVGTHDINVTGTLNVLEASRLAGVKKFVFTSTCAVYGVDNPLPLTEDQAVMPESPYGLHKLMGEQYMTLYAKLFDMQTVTLRYMNVYGPRKLAEGGYPMVISVFLKQKQEGTDMTITGDGETTRDYVHVSDVVKANIQAWQQEVPAGSVINIGTGRQISVNDIAKMIGGNTSTIPERKGELRAAEANIERASSLLSWKPTVVFEEGLAALKKEWGVE